MADDADRRAGTYFFCIVVGLNVDGEAFGMPAAVVASHMSWPSFAAEAVVVGHAAESSGPQRAVAVAPVVAVMPFDRYSVAVVCKYRLPD